MLQPWLEKSEFSRILTVGCALSVKLLILKRANLRFFFKYLLEKGFCVIALHVRFELILCCLLC